MEDFAPYEKNNKQSIILFAKNLIGKTLKEACPNYNNVAINSNKGNFGQMLEKEYFKLKLNNESRADFEQAGLELKSTPIIIKKSGEYKSKERLVLNIINYEEIVNQNFETSSFIQKNKNLLLVIYIHELEKFYYDFLIQFVNEWSLNGVDLEIIKKDWEFIKLKVLEGKAHEISEGDTLYLGACTKGSKGGNLKKQPYSENLAKQRAFSLKQGYVNHIIATIAKDSDLKYGKFIKNKEALINNSLEETVITLFKPYIGLSEKEIIKLLDIHINFKAKNAYANLTKAILGVQMNKEIEEFEKADIQIKTIRIKKKNNLPKEDISFPSFQYEAMIKEIWEDSEVKSIFERKFFFVFFEINGNENILKKVKFWTMPFDDLVKVEKVWSITKDIIKEGNIVKEVEYNGKRRTNFPGKKFNSISHVRPHAKNSNDTYPLPQKDSITSLESYTKHCFWLNAKYVRDNIYLKD